MNLKPGTIALIEHNRITCKGKFATKKVRKSVAKMLWEVGTKNFRDWIVRGINF